MDVTSIYQNKKVRVAVVSAAMVGCGVGVYFFVKRRKAKNLNDYTQLSLFDTEEETFEDIPRFVVERIMDPDEVIELLTVSSDFSTEEVEAEGATEDEAIVHILQEAEVEEEEEKTPVPFSVFSKEPPIPWDEDAEVKKRAFNVPYILHQDEFINSETGFKQQTYTYYVADDILADQDDTPVYDYSTLLGELRFGHGSNDQNVVYIRNEKARCEWEVLQHPGSFAYEVLGQSFEEKDERELRHSMPKFRAQE